VVVDLQMGRERKYRPRRAIELTQLLSSLGPAIIKAGQALSSRSDLLPKEYLTELQKLQDQVRYVPLGGHVNHCTKNKMGLASAQPNPPLRVQKLTDRAAGAAGSGAVAPVVHSLIAIIMILASPMRT
jgi:hypothetical protein